MSSALEEVADVAREVAADQQVVARKARRMQRRRDEGWSWARILDREGEPHALDLVRRSARRLTVMAGRLARAMARGLADEGSSRRQIAARLGVTHQRITALLTRAGSDRSR